MDQSWLNEEDAHFPNLELLARQVVEGFITGLHKSPFHGFSVEFAEHRLYNSGDNIRNVDWKLYARTGKLFSKRYEEETNLRCQFVLDVSSSMYFPSGRQNKLRFAVQAIASLIYLLKRQRDAFGLSCFSEQLGIHTPARSTVQHQKMLLNELEKLLIQPDLPNKTELATSLHQLSESVHKRSLVIVFSDLLNTLRDASRKEAFFSALQHLKFNRHEVVIFHVMQHKQEIEFDFENRPYEFTDLETGQRTKVHAGKVRENYQAQMSSWMQELELKCAQYRIDLVSADIDAGYYPVLQAYLIKRQRLQ
ncbi:DUF58 domain-containing protein [Pedobacter yulinensis]|uniref:DUF58 domain-containing protein n=1 Tax=Pedobacter yulinensis TaxID=2126353 RepID=A0A2T3HIL5_9SPHI|nr:DUF58 domain-containing protein [Pedobacter yulinensis]PST82284.1 DUF58 domain-containing protein [Pedobacter yulinensis]